MDLIFFPISARSKAEREGGRGSERMSTREGEKHHCFEPRTKEISAPILGHSIVVTETSLITKASVYLRAWLPLHFAPGRKQTDSKVPVITCNQTGDPSPPALEQTACWRLLPQKSDSNVWRPNLTCASATSWAAASLTGKIKAGGFRFRVLSLLLPLLSSAQWITIAWFLHNLSWAALPSVCLPAKQESFKHVTVVGVGFFGKQVRNTEQKMQPRALKPEQGFIQWCC